jgi:hypothetical protein
MAHDNAPTPRDSQGDCIDLTAPTDLVYLGNICALDDETGFRRLRCLYVLKMDISGYDPTRENVRLPRTTPW